jgi:hypothetical protein
LGSPEFAAKLEKQQTPAAGSMCQECCLRVLRR